jgi:hypothetical protein
MSKPTAEGRKTRRAALRLFAGAPALATLPVAAIAAASVGAAAVPPEEKIVTAEQMAAMDFKPWEHLEDGWRVPSNEQWIPFGDWALPNVRIAWIMMFKTKAELETIARELDDDTFEAMVNGIGRAGAAFEDFVRVLRGAETRIMCAAASAMAKDDPEGLADVCRGRRDLTIARLRAINYTGRGVGPPLVAQETPRRSERGVFPFEQWATKPGS